MDHFNDNETRNFEKQKTILASLTKRLFEQDGSLYYESTSIIAHKLRDLIHQEGSLNVKDKEVMNGLSSRDIEILLSHD